MKPAPPDTAHPPPSGPPAEAPPRPRRKRRWGLVALLLLPLLLIGGFFYYWFWMRPYESTDDAFVDGNVVPISPRVPGQVIERFFKDNQYVKAGQPLLQIDPRDFEARVAQAQAGVRAAQTRLEQARAQLEANQALVAQAQANLVAAQTEAERANADLKRYQALRSPAVSRSQLDLALAQARSNNAAVEVVRSRIAAAQAQVTLSQAAIQTAQADIGANQAVLQETQLELSYTRILAPTNGFVANRNVEAGAFVQAGQNLFSLVVTPLWVTANFKETQLAHMRPGQPVTISVDAFSGHDFHGHVDSIQRGSGARFSLLPPENATGNYVKVVQRVPVKILFDDPPNPDLPLGPGMSAEPTVRVLGTEKPQNTATQSPSPTRRLAQTP